MNNEPVAWMWSEDGCDLGVCLEQDKQIGKQEFQDYSIPLYTQPHPDNLGLAESIIKQQQLEIEALKKQLDTRTKELIGASFYEHDYKTMMANSEPVAWWTGEFNDEADDFMFDKTKQNHMNHINSRTHEFFPIPLYTHPVKELTDEEIYDVFEGCLFEGGFNKYEFARAILRKAQEK